MKVLYFIVIIGHITHTHRTEVADFGNGFDDEDDMMIMIDDYDDDR